VVLINVTAFEAATAVAVEGNWEYDLIEYKPNFTKSGIF
jgi:hypothetical protein